LNLGSHRGYGETNEEGDLKYEDREWGLNLYFVLQIRQGLRPQQKWRHVHEILGLGLIMRKRIDYRNQNWRRRMESGNLDRRPDEQLDRT